MYGDPTKIQDHRYLAHMLNDFMSPEDEINISPKTGKELGDTILRYKMINKEKSNAKLANGGYYCFAQAIKDIEPGEEILVNYGYPYWCKVKSYSRYEYMFREYFYSLPKEERTIAFELATRFYIQVSPNGDKRQRRGKRGGKKRGSGKGIKIN